MVALVEALARLGTSLTPPNSGLVTQPRRPVEHLFDLHDLESVVDRFARDTAVGVILAVGHVEAALLAGEAGFGLARRTVAKYREAMRIPSSVQRRRDKQSALGNVLSTALADRSRNPEPA